ncbi:D-alanyl-D-alanine carboxypeptidase [Paenibacillus antri]|uniref:serine-type D-Ala-D-Ala carboxypeptidase n=1 Tax=Paenibacillus antri TaxID=2582848 RepID=A0A5R9G9E5_9BACL|nr:D-alanyl-D-alanine carboxypeptidase family protein [Paenibacillus antri]TLS50008.1 D-alanyl-D-alanine carboxypeptidase [Paenibacillus antri]
MLRKRTVRAVFILLCALFVQGLILSPQKVEAESDNVDLGLNVKSAILMELTTGQIIYGLNENEPRPPASMAKMMTEYLVMRQIETGKISWDDMVMTSKNAADAIGSGQLMAEGQTYPLRKVFELLSIYSGNDAAIALAEHISGTQDGFAKLMNETAKELGMSEGARFINSTGLERDDMVEEPAIEGETLMSAKDAAILARAIITEYPEVLEFTKIPQLKFEETDAEPMVNWNWMVEGNKDSVSLQQFAYEGLDGLKTGNTNSAGYCFTGTAEQDGMRLVSVVMGADSISARFNETRKLLDYGFNNFEVKTILSAKTELPDLPSIQIRNAVNREAPVLIGEGLVVVGRKGEEGTRTTKYQLFEESKLVAPLQAGAQVGSVTVTYQGSDYEVPLVVAEDVEQAGWFQMMLRGMGDFFSNLFSGITGLIG